MQPTSYKVNNNNKINLILISQTVHLNNKIARIVLISFEREIC